jgi:DNA repair photolyase
MQMAKRFGKVKTYSEWIKPRLVSNALELLDKEIPKYKNQIKFVHLCFMTDPFMYRYREVSDMSLNILEKLNKNNIRCTVLTKGAYPKELTDGDRFGNKNEYGITLVSLNDVFKKKFEPNSSPYLERLVSLKRLHKNGLNTWVSMEPYPTPNLVEQDLIKILKTVSFVDKIVFGKLNYNVRTNLFKNNKEFYNGCAKTVIDFCKEKGIEYHIKYGTQERDNKKTESLFKKKTESRRI